MDRKILDMVYEIRKLSEKIDKLTDDIRPESMESKIAFRKLESLAEMLNDTQDYIEHFSKPTKEGYLIKNDRDKFELMVDGKSLREFSCGSSIEIYLDGDNGEGWYPGRVEHRFQQGYYFYGDDTDKPLLEHGMKARIRVINDYDI